MYLAAVGPKNLELSGELFDGWLAIFYSPDFAKEQLAQIEAGRAKVGKTLEGFDVVPDRPDRRRRRPAGVRRPRPRATPRCTSAAWAAARRTSTTSSRPAWASTRPRRRCRTSTSAASTPRPRPPCRSSSSTQTALLGPKERIAEKMQALAASGVTTLTLSPFAGSHRGEEGDAAHRRRGARARRRRQLTPAATPLDRSPATHGAAARSRGARGRPGRRRGRPGQLVGAARPACRGCSAGSSRPTGRPSPPGCTPARASASPGRCGATCSRSTGARWRCSPPPPSRPPRPGCWPRTPSRSASAGRRSWRRCWRRPASCSGGRTPAAATGRTVGPREAAYAGLAQVAALVPGRVPVRGDAHRAAPRRRGARDGRAVHPAAVAAGHRRRCGADPGPDAEAAPGLGRPRARARRRDRGAGRCDERHGVPRPRTGAGPGGGPLPSRARRGGRRAPATEGAVQ